MGIIFNPFVDFKNIYELRNMFDDDDYEISELDIESRTWNKLEKKMKSLGFREGAAKGKDSSLQEGFNLGFLEGFKVGERLGMVKGIMTGKLELKLANNEESNFDEEAFNNLSCEACILCSKEKMCKMSSNDETPFEKFEDLISAQVYHSDEVIKSSKKFDLNDFKSYLGEG